MNRVFVFGGLLTAVSSLAFAVEERLPHASKPNSREVSKAVLLGKYDKNKNGKLDADEVETIARERLQKFDDNHDGKVDSLELKRQRPEVRKAPKMDALQRAMAREKALEDQRVQDAKKDAKSK